MLVGCYLAGVARWSFDQTLTYVQQRQQFGRPIGSFQAVQHIVADMYASTRSLENMCAAAAEDLRDASPQAVSLRAACLKAYAAESSRRVCENAIQMHGGIGYTFELSLHWYYEHALALRSWFGDERDLEREIGFAVLAGGAARNTTAQEVAG
jgi:alkylation response protein AidB-like acyl-CoA dehydrogenase